MSKTPVVYKSKHRIKFSELDPYNHVRTAVYSAYFVDHRMDGLREHAGWDLKTLAKAPFMVWVKRMEVDFLRPAVGDQEVTITSFVREFRGPDAHIECTMVDEAGKNVSRCLMHARRLRRQEHESGDGLAGRYDGAVLRKSNGLSRVDRLDS
jgi:acyl-CoA thioester hydrolase